MTSAPGLTYQEVKALDPCADSFRRVTELLGGAEQWNGKKISAREAREAGATYDDILWAACRLARADTDVERRLRLFAADCAARVLHLFERERPTDMRPRNAIIAARQFVRGEITKDTVVVAKDAAREAADETSGDPAWDAAWVAIGAVTGIVFWIDERAWQFDRMIARLSEEEPEDYPLPEPPR